MPKWKTPSSDILTSPRTRPTPPNDPMLGVKIALFITENDCPSVFYDQAHGCTCSTYYFKFKLPPKGYARTLSASRKALKTIIDDGALCNELHIDNIELINVSISSGHFAITIPRKDRQTAHYAATLLSRVDILLGKTDPATYEMYKVPKAPILMTPLGITYDG